MREIVNQNRSGNGLLQVSQNPRRHVSGASNFMD
jgi:hypothetical protein